MFEGNNNYIKESAINENQRYGIASSKPKENEEPIASIRGYNIEIKNNAKGETLCEEWAKVDFINNLPNFKNGIFNTETGEETDGEQDIITDFIPVTAYTNVKISNDKNLTMKVMYYDTNKNFLWHENNYDVSGEFKIERKNVGYIKVIMDNSVPEVNLFFDVD